MAKEETKEDKEKFVVTDVPTQVTPMIVDTTTKTAYTTETALAKIMNDLERLKKLL